MPYTIEDAQDDILGKINQVCGKFGLNNIMAQLYAVLYLNNKQLSLSELAARLKISKGSASIKNILPVLVPELTYKVLHIQKGDQAVERWEKMIDPETPQEEKDQIAKDLLEYCKLDTFAMVEIYRFLKKL